MGLMDRFKSFVEPGDDEEYVEEDEVVETAEQSAPAARPAGNAYEVKKDNGAPHLDANTKMVLFEPRSLNESELAGNRMKEGRAVVVNLHKLTDEYARRMEDFLTGVAFALGGELKHIGPDVILCYPKEIGVAGSINLNDEAEEESAQ